MFSREHVFVAGFVRLLSTICTSTTLFQEHRCHHIADSGRSLGRSKPNSIECSRDSLNFRAPLRVPLSEKRNRLPASFSSLFSSFQFRVLRILFFSCSLTMNGCRYLPTLFPVSNECLCEQLAKTAENGTVGTILQRLTQTSYEACTEI